MVRNVKTNQTSLGFFDEAIAAPSMKAALEAWGTKTNLFHQGVAKEADDPEIIAATMRKPDVIIAPYRIKRPIQRTFRLAHTPASCRGKGQTRKTRAKLKARPPQDRGQGSPQGRTGVRK